ncbi:MAG: hypothetical protein WDW36_001669 [Sanguina aurantia]
MGGRPWGVEGAAQGAGAIDGRCARPDPPRPCELAVPPGGRRGPGRPSGQGHVALPDGDRRDQLLARLRQAAVARQVQLAEAGVGGREAGGGVAGVVQPLHSHLRRGDRGTRHACGCHVLEAGRQVGGSRASSDAL